MKKAEYSYLRIRFRIVSDRIEKSEIEKLIGFQELKPVLAFSTLADEDGRVKELRVMGKAEGKTKWEMASKVLDWVKGKEDKFKQLRKNSDVELEIATVCNIKGVKNPFPEEIKKLAVEMKAVKVFIVAESKESVELPE